MEARTTTITIFGEKCEVSATKTGKTTWHAYGEYKGQPIEGQGARSEHQAFKYWEKKAKTIADKLLNKGPPRIIIPCRRMSLGDNFGFQSTANRWKARGGVNDAHSGRVTTDLESSAAVYR